MIKSWCNCDNSEYCVRCAASGVYIYTVNGRLIHRIPELKNVTKAALKGDTNILVIKTVEGRLFVIDLDSMRIEKIIQFSELECQDEGFVFSKDGKWLLNIEKLHSNVETRLAIYHTDSYSLDRVLFDESVQLFHIECSPDGLIRLSGRVDDRFWFIGTLEHNRMVDRIILTQGMHDQMSKDLDLRDSGFADLMIKSLEIENRPLVHERLLTMESVYQSRRKARIKKIRDHILPNTVPEGTSVTRSKGDYQAVSKNSQIDFYKNDYLLFQILIPSVDTFYEMLYVPNSSYLVAKSSNGMLIVVDTLQQKIIKELDIAHTLQDGGITVTQDGRYLYNIELKDDMSSRVVIYETTGFQIVSTMLEGDRSLLWRNIETEGDAVYAWGLIDDNWIPFMCKIQGIDVVQEFRVLTSKDQKALKKGMPYTYRSFGKNDKYDQRSFLKTVYDRSSGAFHIEEKRFAFVVDQNKTVEWILDKGSRYEKSIIDTSKSVDSLQKKLERMILDAIRNWDKADIYAISLFVYDEDDDPTKPTVTLGYNTEGVYRDMAETEDDLEARWNYACWQQNEVFCFGRGETSQDVSSWIQSLDDSDDITQAFVRLLIGVVQNIHQSRVLTMKYGTEIPLLIHELEYDDEIAEQNIEANGESLVKDFVSFCREF